MIRSNIKSRYRDKAVFATKYTASALGVVFAVFAISYIPSNLQSPHQYEESQIDPSIFVSSELWIILGILWLAVLFKPRYFIFW